MSSTLPRSVFDSPIYRPALEQWRRSRNPEHRALAINLNCDHRISPDEERLFRNYFKRPFKGTALRNALIEFQRKEVRKSPPVFRDPTRLIAEYRSRKTSYRSGFDPDVELVNVLNLTYLRDILLWAKNENRPEWRILEDIDFNDFEGWLDRKVAQIWLDSGEIENFVSAVFDVLNFRLVEKGAFNPKWVTTWDRFAPHIKGYRRNRDLPTDRWNQAVGVGTVGRCWQIVVKYPAKVARCLYRPTQLEGGYYAFHFPSPPLATLANGGHPMDLAGSPPQSVLLPEYIHEQIILKIDYWKSAGSLIGYTERKAYYLSPLRKKHRSKLMRYYDQVDAWMPQPI
jgi:hypothetical protein